LTNKSPYMVNICASSHRGWVSRLWFILYHFSPIYRVFVPPKYLGTWQNHYQMLSESFCRYRLVPTPSLKQNWIA
jgi:hypothetical protein